MGTLHSKSSLGSSKKRKIKRTLRAHCKKCSSCTWFGIVFWCSCYWHTAFRALLLLYSSSSITKREIVSPVRCGISPPRLSTKRSGQLQLILQRALLTHIQPLPRESRFLIQPPGSPGSLLLLGWFQKSELFVADQTTSLSNASSSCSWLRPQNVECSWMLVLKREPHQFEKVRLLRLPTSGLPYEHPRAI